MEKGFGKGAEILKSLQEGGKEGAVASRSEEEAYIELKSIKSSQ